MIAVDTSALMTIVLGEPQSDACIAALEVVAKLKMSAEAHYHKTMADVSDYLINDVFDCGPIGSHI
jgi:uncharacterized protein with PIN domain